MGRSAGPAGGWPAGGLAGAGGWGDGGGGRRRASRPGPLPSMRRRKQGRYDMPDETTDATDTTERTTEPDELEGIEDLDELEFLLEEIESKIAPLALSDHV